MSEVEKQKTRHKRSKENSKRKERKDVIMVSKSGESADADVEEITNQNNANGGVDKNTSGKIDVHTLNYFKRVEKLLNEDAFEDVESKGLFLNNVLAQVGVGMRTCQLARHRLTSKILENLIEMCNAEQFSELFESLMKDVLAISRDRFGSHVLQKAVCMILKHLKQSDEVVSTKIIGLFFQFLTEMKKNLPSLVRDTYASHILSSLIQVLAGIRIPDNVTRSRNSQASKGKQVRRDMLKKTGPIAFGILVEKVNYPVPDAFQKKLHKFAKRILKDFNFGELLCHKNASIVIQILLLALKECEVRSCERLCNIILEKSKVFQQSSEMEADDTNKRVPILFADEVGSHVMEKIFYVASNDLYELIFSNCFKKNLLKFSLHPLANFILQHMLRNIPVPEIASTALEELIPYTEDILASGNMGVVIRMAELAQRFDCKQKDFLSALSKAFHLPPERKERNSLIKLLLTLSTYDVMFEKKGAEEAEGSALENNANASSEVATGKLSNDTMNYHGSCLSKVLFHFKDPKILAKSLLSLRDELLFLMHHEYGSFVVEEFIASKSVSKSHKTKFLLVIKDDIVAIAKDKFGSHVIDKLWENGTDDERKIIRAKLFRFRGQLKGNMYGRIVLRNCGLESFHLPNTAAGKDHSSRTEEFKADEERKVSKTKHRKKRKGNDLHMNETKDGVKNKKARNDLGYSYNDEFLKLGVGICSNEDEMKEPKDIMKTSVGKESSREIDELFAKGSKKKKGQTS